MKIFLLDLQRVTEFRKVPTTGMISIDLPVGPFRDTGMVQSAYLMFCIFYGTCIHQCLQESRIIVFSEDTMVFINDFRCG